MGDTRKPIHSGAVRCKKHLPLFLLDTAHLKPRCLLPVYQQLNFNLVEFMCKYCHTFYDTGSISVNSNGNICISNILKNYGDLEVHKFTNTKILNYNYNNIQYYNFHYKFIYNN